MALTQQELEQILGGTDTVKPLRRGLSQDELSTVLGGNSKPITQVQQQPQSTLRNASQAITGAYNFVGNLPVIKQATQGVGLVSGALGGLVGGVTGGIAQGLTNIAQGRPTTAGVGQAALKTAKETAGFGYTIGKEGALAAGTGIAGKLPNAILAAPMVFEGVEDIKNRKFVEGGIKFGIGIMAGRGALKQKGVFINQDFLTALDTPPNFRNKVLNYAEKQYDKALNIKPKIKQDEIAMVNKKKLNQTTSRFLAENKISGTPEDMKQQVSSLLDDTEAELQSALEGSKSVISLNDYKNIGLKKLERFKSSGTKYKRAVAGFEKTINALKEQYGDTMSAADFNQHKRFIWQDAYSIVNTKLKNDIQATIGNAAKEMIEKAVNDVDIAGLNKTEAQLIQALRVLDKSLSSARGGGRLSTWFGRVIGAIAGASNPLTALAGAQIGGQVVNKLNQPQLKTGAAQAAIRAFGGR